MREHETTVRVRFCEVDSYHVAWHGHYLAWMEIGRNGLAGGFGLSVTDIAAAGFVAPVIDLQVKYLRPARFDEELRICTTARRMETATLAFDSRIVGADGAVCATGRTVHVLADTNGVMQYKLPAVIAERMERMLSWTEGA